MLRLFLLVGFLSFSTALKCYSCIEFHDTDDRLAIEMSNCSSPNSEATQITNCSQSCATNVAVSHSVVSIQRQCSSAFYDMCNNCTDPTNCQPCCSTDLCNDEPLTSLLETYRLAQFCYKCQYSEIPGKISHDGCGLDFDDTGLDVEISLCRGLCYSATTFITGVEDIRRGCAVEGRDCDQKNHPYLEDKSVQLGDLDYDFSCCTGDLCNIAAETRIFSTPFILGISFLVGVLTA